MFWGHRWNSDWEVPEQTCIKSTCSSVWDVDKKPPGYFSFVSIHESFSFYTSFFPRKKAFWSFKCGYGDCFLWSVLPSHGFQHTNIRELWWQNVIWFLQINIQYHNDILVTDFLELLSLPVINTMNTTNENIQWWLLKVCICKEMVLKSVLSPAIRKLHCKSIIYLNDNRSKL